MSRHKGDIALAVTTIAGVQVEFGNVTGVAIATGERFLRGRELMTV